MTITERTNHKNNHRRIVRVCKSRDGVEKLPRRWQDSNKRHELRVYTVPRQHNQIVYSFLTTTIAIFSCLYLAYPALACPSAQDLYGCVMDTQVPFYLPPLPPTIPPIFPPVRIPAVPCSRGSEPTIRWRSDGRCGPNFSLGNGGSSECDPQSDRPCCSDYGYCGNSLSHCGCADCIDYRNVIREQSCYFKLEGETGLMESPRFPQPYPVGQDCCYDIARPSQQHCGVMLTVEHLDLGRGEEEGYCRGDWLSLPSCVPERGTRICGNVTGQNYQYLFQHGASAMRFVFHASSINEGKTGFSIRYELLTTCPGPYQTQNPPITPIPGTTSPSQCYTRITDPTGTVNTPYHPKNYPAHMDCVYEFIRTSPEVCGIMMQSVNFETAAPLMTRFGGACTDFLHLPSCGFLCGKANFSWVAEFQPGATSLRFHFHADETPGFPGFLVNFKQVTQCGNYKG